ncbi:flagellin lysine-N-methylase [Pseudobutyrivibrio sp.]|uniref:flagellin lysine-N-methylase n=1 Tax=Pseudobutyrivibrio sp. TaxID=2014367 RepID=UPI001D5D0BC2|nr:flagellin lysine-N-methylase [Pseudobutyrivibrio sp.]MBE5909953.1 hypothetical protein [Pseudobutyrivibrio sp.]
MKYLYPDYYDNFKCISDKCPKTCCGGWQIEIDEDSLEQYRSMGIKTVDFDNEIFHYDDKKMCLNLREDGLCRLILEHGENILCKTCATFPRHIEEFEGNREYSLSISCPEVARIILNRADAVSFYGREDDTADCEDYDDFEQEVYGYLAVLRERFLQIAQDRSLPFAERAAHILSIAEAFQSEIDFAVLEDDSLDSLDMGAVLNVEIFHIAEGKSVNQIIFGAMKEWEYTGDEFEDILKFTEGRLYLDYNVNTISSLKSMVNCLKRQNVDFEVVLEQILVYFIYAYFCGSAYDEYYYGQAQLAVATCMHIRDLCLAHYLEHKNIALDDIIRLTYLYARELEHSIPNILATEKYMDEHPLI